MIRAILTDIEGTTTALSFVQDVLFPYARAHLPAFVRSHADDPDVQTLLHAVRAELDQPDLDEAAVIQVLLDWIAVDKKATPLKALQGMIWEAGYRSGAYQGQVYADAARQLRAWQAAGIALYVFSSGSVKAQQLLFAHSEHGDLTPLFSGYFDTTTGPKRERLAYQHIAAAMAVPPAEILFLSDIAAELDAAAAAGLQTCQLLRDDSPMTPTGHPQVRDFDAIALPLSAAVLPAQ